MLILSPNISVMPSTARVNSLDHLVIGGLDTVILAEKFGTPLWVLDEQTIRASISACQAGLSHYPKTQIVYAGKAFLCLAMCHLLKSLKIGLDVVSEGELLTAIRAGFPAKDLLLHGNNKSASEVERALAYGPVRIVIDNYSELEMVSAIARQQRRRAQLLLRVIPGVEPDTHSHIKTGHSQSKFGVPLKEVDRFLAYIKRFDQELELIGLHVHIGSQANDLAPFIEVVEILADCLKQIKDKHGIVLEQLDLGGGLGIVYQDGDNPPAIYDWAKQISEAVQSTFAKKKLNLPQLILEPGRALVGTAGVTLYRVGHTKQLDDGTKYIAVDGGMADNPRPITYQARYTACIANRMNSPKANHKAAIVGKYCEQGDIIIKETQLEASTGDIIAIFGTGAYNFSMSSNYNRTARPACILVADSTSNIILEREGTDDLLRNDRVPERLQSLQATSPLK